MPAALHRVLAPIGRAATLSLVISGAVSGAFSLAAHGQTPTQGGMVSADPAQAGTKFEAKPKQNGARGNASGADAAAHPAAQPAPRPRPTPTAPQGPAESSPPAKPAAATDDHAAAAPTAARPAAGGAAEAAAAAHKNAAIDPTQVALIEKGHYIAIASDCAPCHMAVGGTPFTGGLILSTPFGQMATPNITPDKATGIGNWSSDQFYGVIHNGIGPHLKFIYPTMVFTSYTKMPRSDVDALYAYLMSLPPVHAPRLGVALNFPFNIRLSLVGWRMLFFKANTYAPDPARSAQWNRGGYLVQGPGHCGECHSPRNALGGTDDGASLAGGQVDSFLAPNISSDPRWGIGRWSEDEIVAFLKTGTIHKGVVFGPMIEVVHESMAHMTDDDVHAIAFYLKNTTPRVNKPTNLLPQKVADASIRNGTSIYATNCSQCHQASGMGVAGSIPNLAGNDAIRAHDPTDAMTPVLAGLEGQGKYGAMPRFGGALNDDEIADLANYIRSAWDNGAPVNATPGLVRSLRGTAPVGIGGSVAARTFGCPKVGDSTVPGSMANEQEVALLAGADRSNLQNGITSVIAMVKKDNPDAASGDVVTALNAAYCPVVATRGDLTHAQKRSTLIAFSDTVGQQLSRMAPADVSKVVVNTSLSPDAVAQINQAAASAGMTPSAFIAKQLSAKAPSSGK